jgi:hypothetical protein
MKSPSVVFLALGVVALTDASLMAQRGRGEPASRYGWISSLEAGKTEARKSGKPLLVVIRCVP